MIMIRLKTQSCIRVQQWEAVECGWALRQAVGGAGRGAEHHGWGLARARTAVLQQQHLQQQLWQQDHAVQPYVAALASHACCLCDEATVFSYASQWQMQLQLQHRKPCLALQQHAERGAFIHQQQPVWYRALCGKTLDAKPESSSRECSSSDRA